MSRTTDNAGLLPELLSAAGHDSAAVEVARIAAKQGFAATSTLALLEAVDPKSSGLARTVLDAAPPAAEDTPPEPERSASEMFTTELRRAAGRGTPGEAEVAQTGAQGRADAETFSSAGDMNQAIRVAAGVVAPDADPAA